jgi:hypothetical protein
MIKIGNYKFMQTYLINWKFEEKEDYICIVSEWIPSKYLLTENAHHSVGCNENVRSHL